MQHGAERFFPVSCEDTAEVFLLSGQSKGAVIWIPLFFPVVPRSAEGQGAFVRTLHGVLYALWVYGESDPHLLLKLFSVVLMLRREVQGKGNMFFQVFQPLLPVLRRSETCFPYMCVSRSRAREGFVARALSVREETYALAGHAFRKKKVCTYDDGPAGAEANPSGQSGTFPYGKEIPCVFS